MFKEIVSEVLSPNRLDLQNNNNMLFIKYHLLSSPIQWNKKKHVFALLDIYQKYSRKYVMKILPLYSTPAWDGSSYGSCTDPLSQRRSKLGTYQSWSISDTDTFNI